MSRHFRVKSEVSGATAKNTTFCAWQLLQLIHYRDVNIYPYMRTLVACAARMAGTLWAPKLTLNNYMVDNISKYACLTVIIDITRKISKLYNF